jgi:hypothetical protein
MTRAGLLVACLAAILATGSAERPRAQEAAAADGITALLDQIQRALVSGRPDDYAALLATGASQSEASAFAAPLFKPGVTRATLRERDRVPLTGAVAGQGYRVLVEALVERGRAATIFTWQFDVRRSLDDPNRWFIGRQEQISSLDGLFQLRLDTSRQFVARDLTIAAIDFSLTLPRGHAFVAETDAGVTCLVLVGNGTMRFAPTPAAERRQVRVFSGEESLEQSFDLALVRFHPSEYAERVSFGALIAGPVDQDRARKAQAYFDAHAGQSFAIALADLSSGHWSLTPSPGDFLADVNTRKHGTLTYARSSSEAEDITLFDRRRRKNIALYASPQKLEARGRFYNEDDLAEFDVLSYDIDVTIAPERELLNGRATLLVRIRETALSNLSLKLADGLTVRSILSPQLGRLMYFRVIGQNGIVVTLPSLVYRGQQFSFTVDYAGRVPPQELDREAIAIDDQQTQSDLPILQPEPRFIYSNRGYWYPQPDVADYALARMRIAVPEGYGCVGSGELIDSRPIVVPGERGDVRRRQFTFETQKPLRYLACVISRFVAPHTTTVPLTTGTPETTGTNAGAATAAQEGGPPFRLTVFANPRQESRGRSFGQDAAAMVQFYSALAGDTPYPSLTLAVTESALPGGHSPAYVAILNQPPIMTHLSWRNDPVNFEGYPSFFLAHEVAHQWWGQAVGWQNYHEQWISEGFAQYFALLYARQERGQDTFMDVLRQMRRWAVDYSDQGPISLGYRLGHIRNDSRIFRSIIYNKAALVLHMLRRLIGDAAFDRGLRRFYYENRFRKAGTDDVRRAFEAESGEDLGRFFDGWIFTADLPTVSIARQIVPGAQPAVKLTLEQQQPELFDMVVPIELRYTSGKSDIHEIRLRERTTEVTVPLGGQLRQIDPDPERITLARFR